MATELDLQTIDDGSVYLARAVRNYGPAEFKLSVTDSVDWDANTVRLSRLDLLQLIAAATALLAETEDAR